MKKWNIPWYIELLVLILAIIFIFLCTVLVGEYRYIRRQNEINSYKVILENLRHRHPLTLSETDIIEPWMTFGYIATLFNVPSDYLKNTLSIEDSRYPNVPIGRYAKSLKIDSILFENKVKTAIAAYHNTPEP